jgi:hypothetical protein
MVLGLSEFPPAGYSVKKSPKTVAPKKGSNSTAPGVLVSIAPQTIQTLYGTGSASVKSSGINIF